mmetsp:Transcript_39296/g.77803  ORF Transcript_39296/g.77803 Transcript_39296/m.77803 type:complete len:200 (-) Transcript_39296:1368-1967(-)
MMKVMETLMVTESVYAKSWVMPPFPSLPSLVSSFCLCLCPWFCLSPCHAKVTWIFDAEFVKLIFACLTISVFFCLFGMLIVTGAACDSGSAGCWDCAVLCSGCGVDSCCDGDLGRDLGAVSWTWPDRGFDHACSCCNFVFEIGFGDRAEKLWLVKVLRFSLETCLMFSLETCLTPLYEPSSHRILIRPTQRCPLGLKDA